MPHFQGILRIFPKIKAKADRYKDRQKNIKTFTIFNFVRKSKNKAIVKKNKITMLCK